MHPPGGVALHLDPRDADLLSDLPRARDAVGIDIELRRLAKVALAPRREADVRPDPRDAERPGRVAVEVVPDDVPDPFVESECIRVEAALGLPLAGRRPVPKLDRPLLRDRRLELGKSRGELWGIVGRRDPDALSGRCGRVPEPRPAEREVLEREPERLGVCELPLERIERGLQRGQLVLLQVELVEEVVLRAERVELLARELVPLGHERYAERGELGAIRVEAARERLVRHLRVPLDVPLHIAGGQRPPLGHQERDEGELPDQLVGVVRHERSAYRGHIARDAKCAREDPTGTSRRSREVPRRRPRCA